jgi:hypothetical protein
MYTIHTDANDFTANSAEDLAAVPVEVLLKVYNHLTGRNPTKFASKAKGQETVIRAFATTGTKVVDLRTVVEPEPEVVEEPEAEKKGRPRVNRGARIRVLAPNHKRPGSTAYKLYALYSDGMSVGHYLELGGTLTALRWDKARNYISVEE